ncbi:amino acid/amide ABC transporter ATP-binding protein 2, HAAT family [Desulfomicrobium apsheronum]|uniref:Amino acid/amide ABC transporter ATP-binding protein 2, HAAT family n=1 Tax=Desulfomicrobium apsheronum TaxID=52560 RepID=A0A1I3WRB0_9BACT|nr:ABC transporter ATP-binding protein [Desulfomicrobium apsheronum]SFK09992.1 amino acid/amide ABC transporter ATP-binding protein 2, HAAT family [Desulfomicrobium apsheronum]
MPLLELAQVCVNYGAVKAVRDVSLYVEHGEVVTLIGANGAGKSTILRAVSGLARIASGALRFSGTDIAKTRPDAIVRAGLAHCPEGRQVLARQSIEDNLLLGAYIRTDKDGIARDLEKSYVMFPRLRERRRQPAGTLSGGEQQMLAIARALMSSPRMLLLDEPSLGLAPLVVEEIFAILDSLSAQGMTILLVEQNARLALAHSHRGYVLESGQIAATGEARALLDDDRVLAAYLGA